MLTPRKTGLIPPPPPGVTPDPNAPAHFKTASISIAAVGIALCTACLVIRIYTKARLLRKFWLDDVFIIIAWVFSLATQAVVLWGYDHAGYGLHIWDFTPPLLKTFTQSVLASAVLYIPALAFAKLALLMLYYVLLHSLTHLWKYTIYTIAFLISGYSIALVLALIFACSPVQRTWDPTVPGGECISRNGVYLATAITNTVSDGVLIGVAVPIVVGLRLSLWQRVGVGCVFGVGGLTIITSILRLATIWPQVTTEDKSSGIAEACIYILIEANFIIMCGCLPYFRQFFRHHAPWCILASTSLMRQMCPCCCRRALQEKGHEQGQSQARDLDHDLRGALPVRRDLERGLADDEDIPSLMSVEVG